MEILFRAKGSKKQQLLTVAGICSCLTQIKLKYMIEKLTDWLIKRRMKQLHIPVVSCNCYVHLSNHLQWKHFYSFFHTHTTKVQIISQKKKFFLIFVHIYSKNTN